MIPEPNFRDDKRIYQRVAGGLGWSGPKPGALVIVGEELALHSPYIYLLKEVEQGDLSELFRFCVDLKAKYKVQGFYGRLDEPIREYLGQWNRERRDKYLSPLHISAAPSSDDGRLQYHLSIAKDKLRVEQKSLFLGEAKVSGLLAEIQTSELSEIKDSEHPLVAALCYAVSALTVWEYYPDIDEVDSDNFNPLTHGLWQPE